MDGSGETSVNQAVLDVALSEPAMATLLANGAPVVVAAFAPPRIVFASASALRFFQAADAEALTARLFGGSNPTAARLSALVAALKPGAPARIEKLSFDAINGAGALTCLCRRTGDEAPLLVIGALGARPGKTAPASLGPSEPAGAEENAATSRDETPAPLRSLEDTASGFAARFDGAPSLRLLWKTDAEDRMTEAAGPWAAILGSDPAALIGRTFPGVARDAGADRDGRLATAFARRETWSGLALNWPIAGSQAVAPITLGGVPSFDRAREFEGFRGFGVIQIGALVARPEEPVAPPAIPDLEPETQTALPPSTETPAAAERPEASDAPQPATPIADEPSPAPPDNVVSLRGFRAAASAVPARAPDSASLPPPVAAPPPDTSATSSRLVELTPAERKAFGDIARALGAKPADEDERARKASAVATREAQAAENAGDAAVAEDAGAAEEGRSDAPEALVAPTATPASDDENDALDTESAPAAAAAQRDVVDLISTSPTAPALTAAEPDATDDNLEAQLPVTLSGEPLVASAAQATDVARNAAAVLERLPVGVLVSRLETPIYLNRALLDRLGFASADVFHEAGGLDRMFHGRRPADLTAAAGGGAIPIVGAAGNIIAVEGRMQTIDWDGAPATLMSFREPREDDLLPHVRALEAELEAAEGQNRELHGILDTATDGVATLDHNGRILSLNRSAEALFGYEQNEVAGEPFYVLLAPESHALATDYLAGLRAPGVASLLNDGRETLGRARQGGFIPLFMTIGRLGETGQKFCAVLRDMTAWKKAESELREARRDAERASQLKSDFLAKISHEIRTPLNAILGFAEVIMHERFGPVGNERYKDYLKDIHASGEHVMSLVNDLLDLSKIEAGKLDLNFTAVDANRIIAECVSLIQPQATSDRVIVRSSLAPRLPKIVVDERSLRQIALNILSNAVKFNEPGGQVIVSTALTDSGHAVLRVKDTGVGMSEAEVQTALEPFRQIQTSRINGGTGLGLPLTKALVEANRANFTIRSKKNEGTLVEIAFPSTRVLAE